MEEIHLPDSILFCDLIKNDSNHSSDPNKKNSLIYE